MRMAIAFLLLIAALDIIAVRGASDNDDDDDEGQDDETQEEEEDETEDNSSVENEAETAEMDNKTEPLLGMADKEWMTATLKDIAYYLRAHKFNDFDRRYHTNEDTAPRTFFKEFPVPPLRSLHWEVRKYCQLGFLDCIQYLHEKVLEADLRRNLDTVTVSRENNWDLSNNSKQIEQAERECQRIRRLDWVGAQPFLGPLERFQWRTSASYYMCWFAMNEEPSLALLGEPCDNFANCLDPEFGSSNGDPRADDRLPFKCAIYSFCPDPCCPRKHYDSMEDCWHAESNPCHAEAPPHHRECGFSRFMNRDFVSIVLNHWNVSCECEVAGYEWNSRFGICIDVDECVRGLHSCRQDSEACFNIAGSYQCGCQWGYLFDTDIQKCVQNEALIAAEMKVKKQETSTESGKPVSILKFISKHLFP